MIKDGRVSKTGFPGIYLFERKIITSQNRLCFGPPTLKIVLPALLSVKLTRLNSFVNCSHISTIIAIDLPINACKLKPSYTIIYYHQNYQISIYSFLL